MQHYSVRPATLDDLDIIISQRLAMTQEIAETEEATLNTIRTLSRPWLEEHISAGRYMGWFAVDPNGEIAAGVGLWLLDWPPGLLDSGFMRGYIINVYTEKEHRKKNLARRLMTIALEWCKENNINVISLQASPHGRHLYESMGFAPTTEMRLKLK